MANTPRSLTPSVPSIPDHPPGLFLLQRSAFNSRIPSNLDTIRIRNLSATTPFNRDAFGDHKPQPALISVTLTLATSITQAARDDALDTSVDYGKLSKAISARLSKLSTPDVPNLSAYAQNIDAAIRDYVKSSRSSLGDDSDPLLRARNVHVHLPKATLHGSGVSFSLATLPTSGSTSPLAASSEQESRVLTLHDITIPAKIGVKDRERLVKQPVMLTVAIDGFFDPFGTMDSYNELEQIVVRSVEESHFSTLEALALWVVEHVMAYWVWHYGRRHAAVRVGVEKPVALINADAPGVEVVRESDPSRSRWAKTLLESLGGQRPNRLKFPLGEGERISLY
jgi:FolB domain-containing protein